MSDTQTAGSLKVGDVLGDKYEVLEVLPVLLDRPRWRVHEKGHKEDLVLTQIGPPSKETDPDKIKRSFERAARTASWIRHPGVVVPRDFLFENGNVYSVAHRPSRIPLPDYIAEHNPPLPALVHWVMELSAMVDQLHESRQPQFLGRIPVENLRITEDGQIQLLGFDISPELNLEYKSYAVEAKTAPDVKFDARSDVWCLGKVMQELIERSKADVKKAFQSESELRNIVTTITSEDPDKRFPNVSTLKSRLEKLRYKDSPKPKAHGVMDAPIQVLTVEEKNPFAHIWAEYRLYLLMGIAAFLLIVAILVNIAPGSDGGV